MLTLFLIITCSSFVFVSFWVRSDKQRLGGSYIQNRDATSFVFFRKEIETARKHRVPVVGVRRLRRLPEWSKDLRARWPRRRHWASEAQSQGHVFGFQAYRYRVSCPSRALRRSLWLIQNWVQLMGSIIWTRSLINYRMGRQNFACARCR